MKRAVCQLVKTKQVHGGMIVKLGSHVDKRCVTHPLYIDPTGSFGNLTKFLRHNSCDPNCRLERWYIRGVPHIGVFATKNIQMNRPLSVCFDAVDSKLVSLMTCSCGSKKCREEQAWKEDQLKKVSTHYSIVIIICTITDLHWRFMFICLRLMQSWAKEFSSSIFGCNICK
jgi:hypothetical protein